MYIWTTLLRCRLIDAGFNEYTDGESSGYQKLDLHVGSPSSSNLPMAKASKVSRQLQFSGEPECNEEKITSEVFSYQWTILTSKLEYSKLFLIYSYIGRSVNSLIPVLNPVCLHCSSFWLSQFHLQEKVRRCCQWWWCRRNFGDERSPDG